MELFKKEVTTVWSFEDRGNWSSHKGDYLGNCSPKVIRNLLIRYSKENDWILDQFLGSGTSAVEALLLRRKFIGLDINKKAIEIAKERTKDLKGKIIIKEGNALKLNIKDNSIDFVCTHPPYLDIIKYSNGIKDDLSLLEKSKFYEAINVVAEEIFRVLKVNKKCAIIIGDVRKKGYIEPLGFYVMNIFLNKGFLLKEIIIKQQHNCKGTEKWRDIAEKRNFLLIQHEYIFVFQR